MIRFGILDHDNHYAQRLVNFFSTRFGSQAEPHLFRSQQALLDYLKDNRLDLVLASTEQLPDPAVLPPKVLTAYLSEDADVEQINRCPAVFRYQRGEALLRRLKGLAAELVNRNATFASSKQGAVLTFLGAGGGTGCTTAAVGCAAAMFPGELDVPAYLVVNAGLLCLHLALGGFCFFASCLFNESRLSVALGAGVPVLFFLIRMLANMGGRLEKLKYATVFTLFDPTGLFRGDSAAYAGAAVLLALGLGFYALGTAVFSRRDLPL